MVQSKDRYLKEKLAEKGKFDYTLQQFRRLKGLYIDNRVVFRMEKEKAFEEAFKTVFGGKKWWNGLLGSF